LKCFDRRVTAGQNISIDEYLVLLSLRDEMRHALRPLADEVEGLVTLSSLGPAPIGLESSGDAVFNVPFTALGVPALSLPLLEVDSLPVGFQLAGFPYRERSLSGVAAFRQSPR